MRILQTLSIVLLLAIANSVHASSDKNNNQNSLVRDGLISKDLYLANQHIILDINALGDVSAVGEKITVSGDIAGDLILAGADINIKARLQDDVRIAGAKITLCSAVTGDVMLAGADITTCADSSLTSDAFIAGNTVSLNGDFQQGLKIRARRISIGGTVAGDTNIMAEYIELLPSAVLRGNITYTSPNKLKLHEGAKILGIEEYTASEPAWWNTDKDDFKPSVGAIIGFFLAILLSVLITALVLYRLFTNGISDIIDNIRPEALRNIGFGVLTLILTPLIIIALLISVIGIPLAIFIGLSYLIFLFTVSYINLLFIADFIHGFIRKGSPKKFWSHAVSIVAASITLIIISMIPLFGLPLILVLYCAAAGSAGMHLINKYKFYS